MRTRESEQVSVKQRAVNIRNKLPSGGTWTGSLLNSCITLLCRTRARGLITEILRFDPAFRSYDPEQGGAMPKTMALKLIARLILRACQKAFYCEQWGLMLDLNEDSSTSFSSFRKVVPPNDRSWADPHVVEADGHYYIFVEEYVSRKRKGHISVIELDGHGGLKGPVPVLERDYHLSYPFVFEWEGRYYMVPESAENETIDLYECSKFPGEWKFKMTLMENVNAVDTTLLYHQNRWWLFTGIARHKDTLPLAELHLFFSSELLTGQWCPHPLNPIVADEARGRPAGRVIARHGKIFRPSQDCTKMYGYGFDLNEVLLVSETDYLEEEAVSVRPDWDRSVIATHTYAREGHLTVIDAFMRKPRLLKSMSSLQAKT